MRSLAGVWLLTSTGCGGPEPSLGADPNEASIHGESCDLVGAIRFDSDVAFTVFAMVSAMVPAALIGAGRKVAA